jgi:hypothetical protein
MWINFLSGLSRSNVGNTSARGEPVRPRLVVEALEDRAVPANFNAANVAQLIASIDAANLTPEADSITLAAGKTFTLTQVNNTTHGATGLPVVAAGENLTIEGNGATIVRSSAAGVPAFRLLDLAAGGSLTIRDVSLAGGLARGLASSPWDSIWSQGGAICSQGHLTLDGVTIRGNTAEGASGFQSWGFAIPGGTASGGAIFSGGELTMDHCLIKNNKAVGGTGAKGAVLVFDGPLAVPGGPGGDGLGGGVFVEGGNATISTTTINSNIARGGKGGRGVNDNSDNSNPTHGGDGGDGLGGGLYAAGGVIALHHVAAKKNDAIGGNGGAGGVEDGLPEPDGNPGEGLGGGLFFAPSAAIDLDQCSVNKTRNNHASTADDDISGP